MPKIEPYAARGVYDPPMYSQAVKVTGTETILFIAGQVAYGPEGTPMHAGDFKAQARAALQCLKDRCADPQPCSDTSRGGSSLSSRRKQIGRQDRVRV